jgi:hypothetical protein
VSLVFKTKPGSTDRVEIAGVGLLGADGQGGKLVSLAANQLQELMDTELPTVDHPRGTPLEGDALKAAAEKFAEDRDLEVVDVPDDELGDLNTAIGSLGEFTPAIDVAEGEARRIYGDSAPPEDGQDSGAWATEPAVTGEGAPVSAPATPPVSPPASPASSTPASSPAASPPASSAAGASSASSSGASSAAATTTP